jgi:ketosteroid isomerase-like protein
MKLGCFAGALALVLIASTPSRAQDAKPKISDPKLRDAVTKYEEASAKMSDGDPEPYIACWSKREDVLDLGTGGGYGMKGFAEISKGAKSYAPRVRTKGFKSTFEYVSVVETKELACVVCTSRLTPPAEQPEGTPLAFRNTLIFRLEDGEWKLAHRHFDTLVNARARRPAEKK